MSPGAISVRFLLAIGPVLLAGGGCSKPAPEAGRLKKMPAKQQFSGFLKDYSAMKANAAVGPEAFTFVNPDKMKSLRRFIAIIVDPVDVYLATNADDSLIPARAGEAVTNYFRHALIDAVSDAFPVVEIPGALVLRLRSALVGVDLGGDVAPLQSGGETLPRAIVLEKVGLEIELLDSESGERIAALVDKEKLGSGAQVGSVNFSREERAAEARMAFNEWASRVRTFLDSEHELTGEDAARAQLAYRPYGR